jgi:hypothetical protein
MAITVTTSFGRNRIEVRQRSFEQDMRGWRPTVRDGQVVESLVDRPVLHGSLRGVVQDELAFRTTHRRRPIVAATLSFEHENAFVRKQTSSAADGSYRLTLPVGRYRVAVRHPAHQPYTTEPGWVNITGGDADPFFRIVLRPNNP